jgi:hypothetical protein
MKGQYIRIDNYSECIGQPHSSGRAVVPSTPGQADARSTGTKAPVNPSAAPRRGLVSSGSSSLWPSLQCERKANLRKLRGLVNVQRPLDRPIIARARHTLTIESRDLDRYLFPSRLEPVTMARREGERFALLLSRINDASEFASGCLKPRSHWPRLDEADQWPWDLQRKDRVIGRTASFRRGTPDGAPTPSQQTVTFLSRMPDSTTASTRYSSAR